MALNQVKFFGDVDRRDGRADGPISAGYPGWYHKRQLEQLEQEYHEEKRRLENGQVPPNAVNEHKAQVQRMGEQIKKIKTCFPINEKNENEAFELYKELGELIKETFDKETSLDMQKGWADPHQVNARNKKPCINIPKKYGKVFQNMNCRIEKDRISRDEAARVRKILGEGLNQFKGGDLDTNIEKLRPQGFHPAYKYEPKYEKDFGQ